MAGHHSQLINVRNYCRFCSNHRELGIGIVPYSPLGRGFFGGKGVVESLPTNNFLVREFRGSDMLSYVNNFGYLMAIHFVIRYQVSVLDLQETTWRTTRSSLATYESCPRSTDAPLHKLP